ncbi:MAG: hypothetical protein HGA86_04195, partial [Anaerolineaceae bacterium]|nr:hypothetical protein [Anaerolineaceae bacterium]
MDYLNILEPVKIITGKPTVETPVLPVSFHFFVESTALDAPGKNSGDTFFRNDEKNGQIIVSMGKKEKITVETMRRAGGGLGKWLLTKKIDHVIIDLSQDELKSST